MNKDACVIIDKRRQRIRNLITGGIIAVVYLWQIYSPGIGVTFSVNNVAVMLLSAFSFGLITYIGVTLAFLIPEKLRINANIEESFADANMTIASTDLCDVCDDVTKELHKLIVNSLQLPDFESDIVDDMNEGITASWLSPCMAYCYGLVTISMLKRDTSFLHSDANNDLQNHVLQKMAKKLRETTLVCKAEESSNQELVGEVAEDLKVVIQAVQYYFNHVNAGKTAAFVQLFEFLTTKVHRELQQKLPEFESITNGLLLNIDSYIDSRGDIEPTK